MIFDYEHPGCISIHALLAESDRFRCWSIPRDRNFYPRSPCGERRLWACSVGSACSFLSTLSLRRATALRASRQQPAGISIHALLAESDLRFSVFNLLDLSFLSTLSLRRATNNNNYVVTRGNISIHALLAESDGFSPC